MPTLESQNRRDERSAARGMETVIAVCVVLALLLGGVAIWRLRVETPVVPIPVTDTPNPTPTNSPYELTRTVKTGFEHSRDFFPGTQDRIYALGDNALRIIDHAGEGASVPIKGGTPTCMAMSSEGHIFFGMGNYVLVTNECGTPITQWAPLTGDAVITSIATSGDTVLVADAGNKVIVHYDKDGKVLGSVGQQDSEGKTGLVVPSAHLGIAVSADGQLWVGNPGRQQVEEYAEDGTLKRKWGASSQDDAGFSGCCNPIALAIAPDGSFITAEKGALARVKVYNADGTFKAVVAGPETFSTKAMMDQDVALRVAVDAKGIIYVLDPIANEVRLYKKRD